MQVDTSSPVWRAVKNKAEEVQENARRQLETTGIDLAETENLRGRISAMKDILSLAEPERVPVIEEPFHA